jgi:uncharacterized protein YndB with AHSA1/START domain
MSEQTPVMAVVQRILPAPPDAVYDEWLDAEGMTEWMCPRPVRPTKIVLDPRVGGRIRIDIDDQGFDVTITGEYLELDRPKRIRFTWWCTTWEPADRSVVTVLLEPDGDQQTLMTIHHTHLPSSLVGGHQQGWTLTAEQFASWLEHRFQGSTTPKPVAGPPV